MATYFRVRLQPADQVSPGPVTLVRGVQRGPGKVIDSEHAGRAPGGERLSEMRGVTEADAHPELTERRRTLPPHGPLGPSGSEGWPGPAPSLPHGPTGVCACGHSLGDTSFCGWEYSFRKKAVISFSAEEKLFGVGEAGSFLG